MDLLGNMIFSVNGGIMKRFIYMAQFKEGMGKEMICYEKEGIDSSGRMGWA